MGDLADEMNSNIDVDRGWCDSLNSLWARDPLDRLKAARNANSSQTTKFLEAAAQFCPVELWPYGNATVINPYLVTLGVSPGNSPKRGDDALPDRGGYPAPTCGEPHPGIYYPDTNGFWERLRRLAEISLPTISVRDAHSLYGHLNLHGGRAGSASDVPFDPSLAAWTVKLIVGRLRPRLVIFIGLQTHLKQFPEAADLISTVMLERIHNGAPRGSLPSPDRVIPFRGYDKANLTFKEWDVKDSSGQTTTYVMWPQHPSKPPFRNISIWERSCREFAHRHGSQPHNAT